MKSFIVCMHILCVAGAEPTKGSVSVFLPVRSFALLPLSIFM